MPQVNHVSGHALSPALGTGGADLPPHVIEVGPNFFPAADFRSVHGGSPARSLRGAVSQQRALGGSLGLRVEAAVLFQFCLTTLHQLGGDLRREGTKRLPCVGALHAPTMEPTYARERRKAFTIEGKDHARRC